VNRSFVQSGEISVPRVGAENHSVLRSWFRGLQAGRWALGIALCAVPVSIAVSEFFLFAAFAVRIIQWMDGRVKIQLPRIFRVWILWAGLEILSWLVSPELRRGWSEMRHLLLIAILFIALPALATLADRQMVWRGIFLASTLCSLFLLGDFVSRYVSYRTQMVAGDEISLLLRSGGLLNHWSIYGTVEILATAGFLGFWSAFPEERRRWWPVAAINGLAILLSLTRMAWVTCFLLVGIDLAWRRSKWFCILPLLPFALYLLAPLPVRVRVNESFRPDYFSNAERVQMLRVGCRMIQQEPLTGVGPGRVEELYKNFLAPGDLVPAYHGHLHNNPVQLAAQFGVPTLLAALLVFAALLRDLLQALQAAATRGERFLGRAGVLALIGFLLSGIFDYTYGHSLGLILLCFAVLSPLLPARQDSIPA
jgi:hypothetical protein